MTRPRPSVRDALSRWHNEFIEKTESLSERYYSILRLTVILVFGKLRLLLRRQEDTSPPGDACRSPCPGIWRRGGVFSYRI